VAFLPTDRIVASTKNLPKIHWSS